MFSAFGQELQTQSSAKAGRGLERTQSNLLKWAELGPTGVHWSLGCFAPEALPPPASCSCRIKDRGSSSRLGRNPISASCVHRPKGGQASRRRCITALRNGHPGSRLPALSTVFLLPLLSAHGTWTHPPSPRTLTAASENLYSTDESNCGSGSHPSSHTW